MSNIAKHMIKEGRALPVFILIDVSGSMRGPKIETVNIALKETINSFKSIQNAKGVIKLCILTFGKSEVKVIKELSKIDDSDVYTLNANGNTPMGMAFDKVYELIEDQDVVSSRDYTPTIVLISDGNPTDFEVGGKSKAEILEWESLSKLHNGVRASKSTRLAMGIGDDVDLNLLKAFINNDEIPVISAKNNATITNFFSWVTMSISTRSKSLNPSQAYLSDVYEIFDDEDGIEF